MILSEKEDPVLDVATIANHDNGDGVVEKKAYLHKVGGFNVLTHRPIISKNNKCIFVVSGHNIRKYLVENGNFLDEYTFGNQHEIVSIQENPYNSDELIVATEDGLIIYWNHVENMKISESYLSLTQSDSSITYFQQVNDVYYFVVKKKKKKFISQLYYCTKNQMNNVMVVNQNDFINNDSQRSIAFGTNSKEKYCVVLFKHIMNVYQIPININSKARSHLINQDKRFTCVAFHPNDSIIATGDSLGQIIIWNSFMSVKASRSIMHWHSQPVADLSFSPSGTYLYSVGAEMVLVKWNLVGQYFGEKNFLPRLGSPIKYVVVDKNHQIIVTSHEDQCLQIIDSQMNGIRTVIEGLSLCSGLDGKLSSGLHYNTRLGALALNGRVGHVQFYSSSRQKQIFQLDVVQQNIISAVNKGSLQERLKSNKGDGMTHKIFPVEVTKLSVSEDGNWLATVEFRDDHETLPEIRLKFWFLKKENNNYFLNTTIHLPHQDEINFITFSPLTDDKSLHLVSTSKDKSFKIWDLNVDKGKKWWNCSRNGTLNSHSIPKMAVFSSDASLLSVLFDNIVTLWELDSPTGIRYIPRMDIFKLTKSSKIIFLAFGAGKFSHYLIEGRRSSVTVRNIIKTFNVVFTYNRSKSEDLIDSIVLNRYENLLALCSKVCVEFLSLKTENIVLKISFAQHVNFYGEIISAVFTPEIPPTKFNGLVLQKSTFYCLNERYELFKAIFKDSEDLYDDNQNVVVVGSENNRKTELFIKHVYNQLTPLSIMLTKKAQSQDTDHGSAIEFSDAASFEKNRKMLVEKFFYSVPSHVLPPVTVFEKQFLSSYLEYLSLTDKMTVAAKDNSRNSYDTNDKRIQFRLEPQADIDTQENHTKPDSSMIKLFLNAHQSNGGGGHDDDDADQDDVNVNDDEFSWLAKYLKALNPSEETVTAS